MENIRSVEDLKNRIAFLQLKRKSDAEELREQFRLALEGLKPINLIKNTVKELSVSPDFKGNLVNSAIGIGAGYLSKKVAFGSTHNPIKKLMGTLLQIGITSIVSKRGDGIKSGFRKLTEQIFPNKNKE